MSCSALHLNLSPPLASLPPLQAGAQISLADVSCSEERCTKWYNLLSRAYMPEISNKDKESRAAGGSDRVQTHRRFTYELTLDLQYSSERILK